jgi:hypothetical protein
MGGEICLVRSHEGYGDGGQMGMAPLENVTRPMMTRANETQARMLDEEGKLTDLGKTYRDA